MTESRIHPEGLTEVQESLSTSLLQVGAVKFGDYKLKLHETRPEAPLSPIYIDLRVLRRLPDAKRLAVNTYAELVRPLEFDLIADIPTAATPFASSLADRLKVGQITPRTDSKTHGGGAKIDGMLESDVGSTAVLIDDLVMAADSKIEAASILQENGILVKDVVVLIDREQGGREELARHDLNLHRAFTMNQMLDFYLRTNTISTDRYVATHNRLDELSDFLKT